MEDATIVTLNGSNPITFEEAFGEYSNLFGKNRAKNLEKHAANQERIQAAKQRIKRAKAATKIVKQETKGDVRVARQEKKKRKKLARIDKRKTAQQARIEKRQSARAARKGSDDDSDLEQSGSPQDAQDDSGSDNQNDPGLPQSGTDNPVQDDQQYAEDDQNPIQRDDAQEEEGGEDDAGGTEEEQPAYEDSFDASNFEGEDEYSLTPISSFEYETAQGGVRERINPKVRECAQKSEWNKEKVCLYDGLMQMNADGENDEEANSLFSEKVAEHKARASYLDGKLRDYVNSSSADGVATKRRAEVNAAIGEAHKLRAKSRIRSRAANQKRGTPLTEVEQGLHAESGPNKITIPAVTSNFDEDTERDGYGQTAEQNSEFAGGVLSTINWKGVIVGVGIGALIIWGATKLMKAKA